MAPSSKGRGFLVWLASGCASWEFELSAVSRFLDCWFRGFDLGRPRCRGGDLFQNAVFDADDLGGERERAFAVRDHNERAMPAEVGERVVNEAFAVDVDLTGGFVEDEDVGVSQER